MDHRLHRRTNDGPKVSCEVRLQPDDQRSSLIHTAVENESLLVFESL